MNVIHICMGSSCFARENKENLLIIREYVSTKKLEGFVRIEGSLCQGDCSNGPNLTINGKRYNNVESGNIQAILEKELVVL